MTNSFWYYVFVRGLIQFGFFTNALYLLLLVVPTEPWVPWNWKIIASFLLGGCVLGGLMYYVDKRAGK